MSFLRSLFRPLVFALLLPGCSSAATSSLASLRGQTQLLHGSDLQPLRLEEVAQKIQPGTIVLIGEQHENPRHQKSQLRLLRALQTIHPKISIGMEFFDYTQQALVDSFVAGQITEAELIQKSGWKNDFAFYRDQILFPKNPSNGGGKTYAINLPRRLTSAVSKGGLSVLTALDLTFLPPQFTEGSPAYKQRFQDAMGGHLLPAQQLDQYFTAQSLWDDTMAWRAGLAMAEDPGQILVIIVGEFHVAYGGGLPDRLKSRGFSSLVTVSLLNPEASAAASDFLDRADILWLHH